MPEPRERDWEKFWIHFICGALVGAIFGFVAWARSSYAASTSAALLPIAGFAGGGALLFGLAAGVAAEKGDDFWHTLFRDWFHW